MKLCQKFLLVIFMFIALKANANDIQVSTFTQLIDSNPVSGDTIEFTNDLFSDETIGNHFINLDINFEGHNHYIYGDNEFGGFVLNQDSLFNEVGIRNCQGQEYNRSKFAGAIFNSGGSADINNSDFFGNFVDANNVNFGVGGAVYNLNGGTVNIDNTLFEANYTNGAASYGGAVANGYQSGNTAVMTINNSEFKNNYSTGSLFPYGGALYNRGIVTINNTTFDGNYAEATGNAVSYGGALFNDGEMSINNSSLTNNYGTGGNNSIGFGGAIYNTANLTITNSLIKDNYLETTLYGDGGAIYNAANGTLTIKNSTLEDNTIISSVPQGNGGAVYNSGQFIIENATFQNNYDRAGDLNDIHNTDTGIIDFNGGGTTNVLSGISGLGTLNKNDSGTLNLGGKNENYTGTFNFNGGTLNLLADASYFNSVNTNFGNNINFNMQNSRINNVNFGNLNLNGTANIYPDVNFNTNTMDRINANSLSGSGSLFVRNLALEGTPEGQYISIPFADSVLKDYVSYNNTTIKTPIYDYFSSYNAGDGNFEFSRQGFNSSVFIPAVAAQLAGYLTQIETYKNVFSNLDMVMIAPPDARLGFNIENKTASAGGQIPFSPLYMPEQRNGVWFKPYTTFEKVQLKNGPDVSNVSYGSLIGVESGLVDLKDGWKTLYGGYAAYNGSHQAFNGNSIYNNGGLIGADAAFYKGKFFTIWTANVGANVAEASTDFGHDDFAMLNTGIAEKTGYNFETFDRKLIIQPSLLMSYTFVNTFDYTASSGVDYNADPLHAIHIEPQIKLIGNFKNYLQPYISVSFIWNIIDDTRFQANDIYLPELSVKPYVQYGLGVQKRWGERLTGFVETMIRNGGRNGIALMFGLRFSI